MEIPEFAATLKAGEFLAVDVTQDLRFYNERVFNEFNELTCLNQVALVLFDMLPFGSASSLNMLFIPVHL